ncbi:septum formation family protein [Microbacterium oxydans]|uniref:Septum formation-related domain-containing protein n=1 Tax=Microbacterium oxydans TaxID=82380 RepID=A0A0F0LBR0_9MICO|nr:DUF2510 domain-containing protein [Microbacterium oxydans]KJL28996.1 hypothetical protein RS83_02479 [Microbacterium oxydans]
MTTPAGWYDDGSGNRRWWDGEQWTAHVVAGPERATDGQSAKPAAVEAATEGFTEPFAPPFVIAPQAAHPGPQTSISPGGYATVGHSVALAPTSAPTPSRRISVLGLIGLISAVVGVALACIPPISAAGWILLGLAFVASIVSLFLRGSKWPGITGVGVSVLGAILALAVSLVSLGISSIVEAGDGQTAPSERPSVDDGSSADDSATDSAEDPSDIEGARMVSFDQLAVGDCLPLVDYGDDDEIVEVPVVPCDRPHTDEVYVVYQFDDDEYPGDDALYQAAEERCLAEFEGFIGLPYEQSELDFYTYWPTEMSWKRLGDRTVHCIAFSYDDVTGTLEGAAR